MSDGADRLAQLLYGRKARTRDLVGGSDAKILHDAYWRIRALQEHGAEPAENAKCPAQPLPEDLEIQIARHQGRMQERERIVAMLRKEAAYYQGRRSMFGESTAAALRRIAQRIEGGE